MIVSDVILSLGASLLVGAKERQELFVPIHLKDTEETTVSPGTLLFRLSFRFFFFFFFFFLFCFHICLVEECLYVYIVFISVR